MKNYLLDINILLDYYEDSRNDIFPESTKVFETLKNKDNTFVSSSSLDNFEYLKSMYLKQKYPKMLKRERLIIVHEIIKEFLSFFKIAKTPSYIEIDYEDIEDSQIIASAKAVNAKVITRDKGMLEKYPDLTIHPSNFKLQTSNLAIDFANLKKQYYMYQPELEEAMDEVLNNTSYIMGDAVKELEENLQKFTGSKHAITCSSGTDALLLAMMALDIKPGDEIITTPFTFIATAETIAFLGAVPVFVDIDEKTYNIDPSKIEAAITEKTKAIMPVSLYGQPADMDAIQAVIDKYEVSSFKQEEGVDKTDSSNFQLPTSNSNKIYLIIDGAQSFGSTYKGKTDSNLGDISTTSFFPAKPLGCFGDGGAVFTNDEKLATKIRSLRVHGQSKRYHHQYIGMGGRMDTLQCAIVNVKLKYYAKDLALRQEVAGKYSKVLSGKWEVSSNLGSELTTSNFQLQTSNSTLPTSNLILPTVLSDRTSAWAQYSIRIKSSNLKLETSDSTRSELQAKLKDAGIPTAVHYPMPLHLQECFAYLNHKKGDFPICEQVSDEIMSLPMNPYVTEEEISYIAEKVLECLN